MDYRFRREHVLQMTMICIQVAYFLHMKYIPTEETVW